MWIVGIADIYPNSRSVNSALSEGFNLHEHHSSSGGSIAPPPLTHHLPLVSTPNLIALLMIYESAEKPPNYCTVIPGA